MGAILALLVLTRLPCAALGAGAPSDEAVERATRQLGAKSFAERQQATEFLWSAGPGAEARLREAAAGRDPEVRLRARAILERFRYGLMADTPAETVDLINRFRFGDGDARREAMRLLVERGAVRAILALAEAEEDAELRREWQGHLDQVVEQTVPPLLTEGRRKEAEEILALAAASDDGMRHWATYLLQTGQLADHLAELGARSPPSPNDARRLVYLWRTQGDLARARDAAAQASPDVLEEILFELRDWPALARLREKANGRGRSEDEVERLGYDAVVQRLAGNEGAFAEKIRALQELARTSEGQAWYCAEALLVNDQVDEALELLRSDHASTAFQILCYQLRYREAFELAGVPYPRGMNADWFRFVARDAAAGSRDAEERFRIAVHAARLLPGLGERELAAHGLAVLADAVQNDRDGRRMRLVCESEFKLGLLDAALPHAAAALAKDTHPYALSILFPDHTEVARMWWEFLRQREAGLSPEERLRRLWALLQPAPPSTLSDRAARELSARAEQFALEQGAEERFAWLDALGQTWLRRNDPQRALEYFERAAASLPNAALKTADLYAAAGNWPAAADWFHQAWTLQPEKTLGLYLQGQALIRAGREVEGRSLVNNALLAPLAGRSRHDLALGLEERGYSDEALEQWKLITRTGPFRQWYVTDATKRWGNAVAGKDHLSAAACWETMLISCLSTRLAFIEVPGYIQIPYLVHKTRARGLLAAGRTAEACDEIRRSRQLWPGNASLAEDLVPELEAAGCQQAADELFDAIYVHIREICEDFPRSALQLNNLAWTAARCDRQLDEALKFAQRAVQLEPREAAYLDTLGEVQFRLGNVSAALHCAVRCLELDPDNEYYQRQQTRFRAAAETTAP